MKFKHTNSSPSIRRRTDINYGEIKQKNPITWKKCQLLYILTFCEIQYLNVFPQFLVTIMSNHISLPAEIPLCVRYTRCTCNSKRNTTMRYLFEFIKTGNEFYS